MEKIQYLFVTLFFILGAMSSLSAETDCLNETSEVKLKVWIDDLPASYKTSFTGGVLPVELVRFSGSYEDDKVSLSWATASELNNEGFDVQRSASGIEWNSIGFVSGQGTTFDTQEYSFEDLKPESELSYYRLKQVDFDGIYEFSKVLSIKTDVIYEEPKLFPNPITDNKINLHLELLLEENIQIIITDQSGKRIRRSDYLGFKGTNILALPTSDLPTGAYFVQLISKHQSFAPMSFQKQ